MSAPSSKALSPVVRRLWAEGKTVPQWAREQGFNVRAVRAVISGQNKGHYGQAHNIAVALGLKASPHDAN